MLDLIGRKADGWVPSLFGGMTYERLSEGNGAIDNAAVKAGRDPRSIRRILNIGGSIEPTRGADFAGPVSFWVQELTRLAVEVRMDAFVFWPAHDQADQIEQFAAEVVPAVREAVGNAR
jgi:alkanesulfonate monooxygenase SsuD/methylene tetrahydromethanopterin reductase-like flavin-dependent oxidoreductase (luciferase family)